MFASNNVISITYKFEKVQSLTLDVQQFDHYLATFLEAINMNQRWPTKKLIMLTSNVRD